MGNCPIPVSGHSGQWLVSHFPISFYRLMWENCQNMWFQWVVVLTYLQTFIFFFPCILTALCLPLVITRAVMMDLDCFVFKKSQLFVQTEKYVESQHQLPKILQKNINSKKVTCRLNIVLLCSTFVNLIVVLLLILFGILIFMVLRW